MNRRIFGFQRRVWWPKWTPASSSCFMLTTATRLLRFSSVLVLRPRTLGSLPHSDWASAGGASDLRSAGVRIPGSESELGWPAILPSRSLRLRRRAARARGSGGGAGFDATRRAQAQGHDHRVVGGIDIDRE